MCTWKRLRCTTIAGAIGLVLAAEASAQTLETPSQYADGENRRVLQGMRDKVQSALDSLDKPRTTMPSERTAEVDGFRPRIVNGIGTLDYPASGALLFGADPRSAKAWCSGTLIRSDKFLTAAHCITKGRATIQNVEVDADAVAMINCKNETVCN